MTETVCLKINDAISTRTQIDDLKRDIQAIGDQYWQDFRAIKKKIDSIQANCEHIWGDIEQSESDCIIESRNISYKRSCKVCDYTQEVSDLEVLPKNI